MKQLEVTILGQVYMLGCPDGGESSLRTAVAAVDREMTVIRNAGKVKARERIAVLAALNLAFQLAEAATPVAQAAQPSKALVGASAAPAPEDALALDELVRRLDTALSEDGQLL